MINGAHLAIKHLKVHNTCVAKTLLQNLLMIDILKAKFQ